MMRLATSRRERRVLFVGGALVLGIMTFSRGLPTWERWKTDARADAAEMRAEFGRAAASVRRLPATLDSLEARTERYVALAPVFLATATPAAGAGSLASLISGMGQAAGVEVGALHVRTDSAGATPIARVSVRADLTGDIRGLTALLLALEGGRPRLAIRELSVSQPEPAAPASQPERLRVQLRVEGLVLVDGDAGVD